VTPFLQRFGFDFFFFPGHIFLNRAARAIPPEFGLEVYSSIRLRGLFRKVRGGRLLSLRERDFPSFLSSPSLDLRFVGPAFPLLVAVGNVHGQGFERSLAGDKFRVGFTSRPPPQYRQRRVGAAHSFQAISLF